MLFTGLKKSLLKVYVKIYKILIMKTGTELIAEERHRQVEVEKWNYSHDADYKEGELIGAAACYAINALNKDFSKPRFRAQIYREAELNFLINSGDRGDRVPQKAGWYDAWPWDSNWDKRIKHDKIRSLVIAGALIAAELDRINVNEDDDFIEELATALIAPLPSPPNESMIEALKQIEQMSDTGDYSTTIVRIKSIATKALTTPSLSNKEDVEKMAEAAIPIIDKQTFYKGSNGSYGAYVKERETFRHWFITGYKAAHK